MTEKADALKTEMDSLLRSLRQCDTQATAVSWMARAYDAMDGALSLIANLERRVKEEASEAKGLIFHIPKRQIEVVQTIPRHVPRNLLEDIIAKPNYTRPNGQTVIYPEFFLHPGLKPIPKPWTRADTLKIENAQKMRQPAIVRKGQ